MKYLSLFSGIGAFELGIQQAYDIQNLLSPEQRKHERENSDSYKSRLVSEPTDGLGYPVCIGFSEIDKYASTIYQKHFPEHHPYGDITQIIAEDLPDFDLLCGGFPCQSFSIAGKRGGFSDTRGTMFFEIARILKAKQPRLLLLENVKGLLSHHEGRTFATIITTLDELGYDCQWQVLNSKDFGVPQNRERVFIVGHLRGTPRPEVFPLASDCQTDIVLPTLTARYWGAQANGGHIGSEQAQDPNGEGASSERAESHNTGEPGRSPYTIRRLTPTECERLQGFPDCWTEEVSDTQRYKTLGNAVTVNVIKALAKKLLA